MRVHGHTSHLGGDEQVERENECGDLLSEAQAQQLAEAAAVCVPRPRHPPFDHSQQQPVEARGIVSEFHR